MSEAQVTAPSDPHGFSETQWVVDFHNSLPRSVDVQTSDPRPIAWHLPTGRAVRRTRAGAAGENDSAHRPMLGLAGDTETLSPCRAREFVVRCTSINSNRSVASDYTSRSTVAGVACQSQSSTGIRVDQFCAADWANSFHGGAPSITSATSSVQ